jgi:chromate transporter
MTSITARPGDKRESPFQILLITLRLGLTSFGGPVAHLGYFRDEFVVKRQWLGERAFADLVALCQFLPGPASSQVGFAVGLKRAGLLGGLSAWAGFTLPSALALTLFAYGEGALTGVAGLGLMHGFKLVAVVIVAAAVLGMARSLTPDLPRAVIAVLALLTMAFAPGGASQIAAIALGGLAGLIVYRRPAQGPIEATPSPLSRRFGFACLAAYLVLLALSFVPGRASPLAFLAAVTRSGALVFGGGHVVLPLLRSAVVDPGWVSDSAFLAGYGAAQAVPGPLFTFAAYLGALATAPPGGALGAALALVAIFLPGILILMGALPFWNALSCRPEARAATAGVNAAVVGLLASALYDPVWTSAVKRPEDFAIAAAGFVALVAGRAPPLVVVALTAASGVGLALAAPG